MARTDTEQYQKGAQKIENMIVLPSGGLTRRPGTVYVDDASLSGFSHKLVPFIFSKTESYYLWLVGTLNSQLYLYAFRPQGVLTAAPVNETVLPMGLDVPRGFVNSMDLSTGGDTFAFTQAVMDEMQFVQSGDRLFLCHKDIPPFYISRTSENTFTINSLMGQIPGEGSLSHILARPYRDVNTTATQLKVDNAAIGSGRTLTADAAIFDEDMAKSGAGEESTYFKVTNGLTTGVFRVDAFVSTTSVTGTVLIAFGASNTYSDNWQESAWSGYRGYPASIGLFESRLIFGGNDAQPDTVWGSMAFNLFRFMQNRLIQDISSDASGLNFTFSAQDTDPFAFTPNAKEVNRIGWIQSGRTLAIGTLGQEFVAQGSPERILSAGSISFVDQTTVGSAPVQAIRINKATVFVSRDGKRIYQYSYDNDSQSFVADCVTALADHIINQNRLDEEESVDADPPAAPDEDDYLSFYGARSLHWHSSRSVLWAITESGDLVGMTWDPQVKTLAWHRHILGGHLDGEDTKRPRIVSGAVVPSENGETDCLGLLVERSINGATSFTFEVMGADYSSHRMDYGTNDLTQGEAPIYADLAICKVLSPASTTVTGLDHLKGEDVVVIADGFFAGTFNVDINTGEIELQDEASVVYVGLPYTPRLKLCPTDAGSAIGSAQGMTARVDRMTVRFYRTLRAIVRGPEGSEERFFFRPPGLPMGDPLPLFTGDKKVNVPMGPEARCELEIVSDQPLPLTILGVVLRGQLNE